jgi:DNA-directed RNA polymerase subunit RPC12/RpoP
MKDQLRIISLKCSSCGSALDIDSDMTQFACGYCGTQQIVERRGGTISLKLLTNAVEKVQVGTDKTAAELALQRLDRELNLLTQERLKLDAQDSSTAGLIPTALAFGLVLGFVTWAAFAIGVFISTVITLDIVVTLLFIIIYILLKSGRDLPAERHALDSKIEAVRKQIEENKAIVSQ